MKYIEFINAQLDYKILLCRSYMYAMKAVTSLVLHIMMFPFNGKVVTFDHLRKYNPQASTNSDNVSAHNRQRKSNTLC